MRLDADFNAISSSQQDQCASESLCTSVTISQTASERAEFFLAKRWCTPSSPPSWDLEKTQWYNIDYTVYCNVHTVSAKKMGQFRKVKLEHVGLSLHFTSKGSDSNNNNGVPPVLKAQWRMQRMHPRVHFFMELWCRYESILLSMNV